VFPGAADLLRRLHTHGVRMVLATSAPDDELTALRGNRGADELIDAQTTADDINNSKLPEVFRTAMKTGEINPGRPLAIGDSISDVQAARAAGIGCVAVESRGFSRHVLSEAGAIQVDRDVRELLQQLLTSPVATIIR
jgi:phosphoglycolate phosphatase-like HAD superfamily hydrolase